MAYRVLCGALGIAFAMLGVGFFVQFLTSLGPGGSAGGPLSPLGPNGLYFMAFTGCGLIGWAGGLFAAVRHPEASRTLGTFSAWAFVAMAFFRFAGWFLGDFSHLGELPRIEAVIFLAIALAFVWLRPPKLGSQESQAREVPA